MNTLDSHAAVGSVQTGDPSEAKDGKGREMITDNDAPDIEHGHLQEIEVDIDQVMNDKGVKDLEVDTSPYPEGTLRSLLDYE